MAMPIIPTTNLPCIRKTWMPMLPICMPTLPICMPTPFCCYPSFNEEVQEEQAVQYFVCGLVRKILSKLGSELLDMINTKPLFLARKRQVHTTCQKAGSELSDSQNGTIAIYIIYVFWPHNVMGKGHY